ncbi:MAG TPA: hypothetical protein VES03_10400 [Motilibacterales bacterium]|nr:hypothetical protein [Motilibacterales bacterium]
MSDTPALAPETDLEAAPVQVSEEVETGSPPATAPETAPPTAPPATGMPPTADPRVDDAVSRLAEVETLPLTEQVAVYADIHRRLAGVLSDPDSQA